MVSTLSIYLKRIKEIEGLKTYTVNPSIHRPHQTRSIDAELNPRGRDKDLVGKGLGAANARLVTVLAYDDLTGSKMPVCMENHAPNP